MRKGISILYFGSNYGTSRHRANALRRLGHNVEVIDPWRFLPNSRIANRILGKLIIEIGSSWLETAVRLQLMHKIKGRYFDVIWNNQCELIGPTTAMGLRNHAKYLVTYAIDDPFGCRDKERFSLYRRSVKYHDLMAIVREPNKGEAYAAGAHRVIRVFMSADEIEHRPLTMTPKERMFWASDVTFIGTWMPERGPFLARLLELGVPLTLYGNRWNKAREYPLLKTVWRGFAPVNEEYVKAVQAAKICLGLISKGNRDLHTSRSAEIPCIGSVLCAERTSEHLAMYQEDTEAIFWSTPEECATKCFVFLADEARRQQLADAGRERCLQSRYLNEAVIENILFALFGY